MSASFQDAVFIYCTIYISRISIEAKCRGIFPPPFFAAAAGKRANLEGREMSIDEHDNNWEADAKVAENMEIS